MVSLSERGMLVILTTVFLLGSFSSVLGVFLFCNMHNIYNHTLYVRNNIKKGVKGKQKEEDIIAATDAVKGIQMIVF